MRRLTRCSFVLTALGVVALLLTTVQPSGAATPLGQITSIATAGITTGFPGSVGPRQITVGPDGLLWFTDFGTINRVNADGTVTSFDAEPTFGANPSIQAIVAGPDGNLWFTKFNPPGQIGRITTAGTMTQVTTFASGNVEDIIVGPDGNLWYTKPFDTPSGVVGRITTAGVTTEFTPPNTGPQPRKMTVGSDGNIWYTDDGGPQGGNIGSILKVTTAGVITLVAQSGVTAGFGAGFFASPITTGPDGNVWTALSSVGGSAVARVTPAGVVTEFADVNLGDLSDITVGCGNLYLTQDDGQTEDAAIWQLTTAGVFTEFTAGLSSASSPEGLIVGPDDDMKITDGGDPGAILNMGTGCAAAPTTTTTAVTTTTTPPVNPAPAVAARPAFTG
jgi:streptogramin lyase